MEQGQLPTKMLEEQQKEEIGYKYMNLSHIFIFFSLDWGCGGSSFPRKKKRKSAKEDLFFSKEGGKMRLITKKKEKEDGEKQKQCSFFVFSAPSIFLSCSCSIFHHFRSSVLRQRDLLLLLLLILLSIFLPSFLLTYTHYRKQKGLHSFINSSHTHTRNK